ncbi:MAG: hypothetical protein GXY36_00635, partial [Chloroflexi bacterium]|nr:hypothetical protein [Chloroflexota bacterium]
PAPKPAPTANTPTPKPPTEAPAPTPKPPAAETPAPAPKPAAAPPPKAAPVAEIPPKTAPAKPGVNPKASGKWSGVGGGLLGVFAPFIMGWVHQKAVEKRVEEQAQKEGYVSPEAPSGQGFLYDLGAWLLDPLGSAEKSVGIDKRFNLGVWRARIREKANSLKPGETLTITWDIGKCSFDFMGNQEVEQRPVTYTKQADGSWKVTKGNPSGTPDLNRIVSPDVPDEVIRAIIERNPCQQWA